jgi:phage gp36-like protein
MSFLIPTDYRKSIQSDNLNQVIGNDTTILSAAELTAIEEITSYLIQKYDLTNEFQPLSAWDKAVVYKASNRVYLDAPAYDAATTYIVGDYALNTGNVYKCTTDTTGAFNVANWQLISPQYTIYFAQYPFPLFDYNATYAVGDQVFWNDKTYTALSSTSLLSQNSALQYGSYQSLPLPNLAPNDVNALQMWGNGTPYTIAANTDITDVGKWTLGDNRSQQLVTYCVNIALYYVHSRIAPRNIPELRVKQYDDAISWLKKVGRGEVTANIPVLKPKQGGRIRYGGNVKNINSY